MNLRLFAAAGAGLVVLGALAALASAQPAPSAVRDFFGEADEDLDPPGGPAPDGMACGSLSISRSGEANGRTVDRIHRSLPDGSA